MKPVKIIALVMALSLWTLSGCSTPQDHTTATPLSSSAVVDSATPPATEPTVTPTTEPNPALAPPPADSVSEDTITVQNTPVFLAERPEFRPESPVQEEELISLHGYSIGMTFAETQQIWKIPPSMVDYAIGRGTPDVPSLYIYLGNMG